MTQPTDDDWRRAIASLRAVVIRRGISGAEVDDVIQRALEKAVKHLSRSSNVAQFEPWLRTIAANEAIDRHRAHQRAPENVEIDEAQSVATREPDADPLLAYADCIEPFMKRLSATDREALTLKEIRGLTFNDLAQTLGVSVSGAKSRVQRARRRLAGALMTCCTELRATPVVGPNSSDCSGSCCHVGGYPKTRASRTARGCRSSPA